MDPLRCLNVPEPVTVGELLGQRYLLHEEIGRGGMGVVWLASDEVTYRPVAIKVLAPQHTTDDGAHARFEREARRLAMFQHPNVVRMYDAGTHRGHPYIVMEYVDGVSLHRFLRRRQRLELDAFIPIAGQICAAVAAAHDRNIMIRDIKPANILVCEHDGRANFVKLLDFGLAKRVTNDTIEVTRAEIVGTTAYVAPEMICGESYDTRIDVYALGILFFVMLTGTHPIGGDNDVELFHNHVYREPLELPHVLPPGVKVPRALRDLIRRCLQKDPQDRPRDAREVAKVLFESFPAEAFELPRVTSGWHREVKAMLRSGPQLSIGLVPDPNADTHRQLASANEGHLPASDLSGATIRAQATVTPGLRDAERKLYSLTGYGSYASTTRAFSRPRRLWRLIGVSLGVIGGLEVLVAAHLFQASEDAMAATGPHEAAAQVIADPSPQAPSMPVGELEITGPAGASVRIDDEPPQALPITAELSSGLHTLRVTSPSHEPWSTRVSVQPGQFARVHATPVAHSRSNAKASSRSSGASASKRRSKRSANDSSRSKPKGSARKSKGDRSTALLPTMREAASSRSKRSRADIFLPTKRKNSASRP